MTRYKLSHHQRYGYLFYKYTTEYYHLSMTTQVYKYLYVITQRKSIYSECLLTITDIENVCTVHCMGIVYKLARLLYTLYGIYK